MQHLVIVESPAKARTLSKYLGNKYRIEASMGHIRDLPKSDLGVDLEHEFEPKYIVPRDKTKKVNELKRLAAEAETLWLATDPDREGEAIAWHLKELLCNSKLKSQKSKVKNFENIHRVAFHEITPEAIQEAFENPRSIDFKLVDAQQARRVLDRIVGYKLSPLLWKKVKSGLSAGRVQSVALRLIVEREREIEVFKPVEYWSIEAELSRQSSDSLKTESFIANLVEKDGKKLAIKSKGEADIHLQVLEKSAYRISKVTKKAIKKNPAPPFITSTLQQSAASKLGLAAKRTMMIAQHLYEHGLITYMRTDSVNLSTQAIEAARKYIEDNFGKAYLPETGKQYKTKSKVAQEAHEAIRPTNLQLTAEKLKTMEGITRDHVKVYELIWKRTLASQMNEAVFDQTSVDIKADNYLLRTSGSVIKFDGWMKLYRIQDSELRIKNEKEDEDGQDETKEQALPELTEGDLLNLLKLLPEQHFTEPPARFNEASLIKKLEELGIGRPSTYAAIISTILDRFYVEKKEKKFFSTPLGMAVIDFLMANFPNIIDYDFTAEMENELDEIARGERQWKPTLSDFYKPFAKKLEEVGEMAERIQITAETTDRICPKCGSNLVVKFGKFGKFLACSGFPDCKHTESMEEKIDVPCPDCGGEVVLRKTKKGRPFFGCKNYPNCKFASWNKPQGPDSQKT